MRTRMARWGSRLVLRIPQALADRLGLGEGQTVEADQLVLRPRKAEPTLDELLAGITPENLPESFDDGPLGKEAL